jgi:hypothetical protein
MDMIHYLVERGADVNTVVRRSAYRVHPCCCQPGVDSLTHSPLAHSLILSHTYAPHSLHTLGWLQTHGASSSSSRWSRNYRGTVYQAWCRCLSPERVTSPRDPYAQKSSESWSVSYRWGWRGKFPCCSCSFCVHLYLAVGRDLHRFTWRATTSLWTSSKSSLHTRPWWTYPIAMVGALSTTRPRWWVRFPIRETSLSLSVYLPVCLCEFVCMCVRVRLCSYSRVRLC